MKTSVTIAFSAVGAMIGFVTGIYLAYLFGWHAKEYVIPFAMCASLALGSGFAKMSELVFSLAPDARALLFVLSSLALITCGMWFWRTIWIT